jgi:hypothetical protein
VKFYGVVMARVIEFIVTIVAFILIGVWLDKKQGTTTSLYTIVLSLAGSLLGFTRLIITLKKLTDESDAGS